MKAYSFDLRSRVIRAVEQGMSQSAAARTFGVGVATVKRYLLRHQANALAPRTSPGRPRLIDAAAEGALRAQLEAAPDATLAEQVERWQREQGQPLSRTTMHRAIERLGWTRTKRPFTPASATRSNAPPGGSRLPRSGPNTGCSSTKPAPASA